MLEVGLHLVLVTRVGVDDVPAEHQTPLRSDVADEAAEDEVGRREIGADDGDRDDDDDGGREELAPRRPLDLAQLGVATRRRTCGSRRAARAGRRSGSSTAGPGGPAGAVARRARERQGSPAPGNRRCALAAAGAGGTGHSRLPRLAVQGVATRTSGSTSSPRNGPACSAWTCSSGSCAACTPCRRA